MTKYNGHPSRNYWNVALWIGNDEGLYRLALECMKNYKPRRSAAEAFVQTLVETNWQHKTKLGAIATPDGNPITIGAVIHAMRGLT